MRTMSQQQNHNESIWCVCFGFVLAVWFFVHSHVEHTKKKKKRKKQTYSKTISIISHFCVLCANSNSSNGRNSIHINMYFIYFSFLFFFIFCIFSCLLSAYAYRCELSNTILMCTFLECSDDKVICMLFARRLQSKQFLLTYREKDRETDRARELGLPEMESKRKSARKSTLCLLTHILTTEQIPANKIYCVVY